MVCPRNDRSLAMSALEKEPPWDWIHAKAGGCLEESSI
jgi:hypothetical protein